MNTKLPTPTTAQLSVIEKFAQRANLNWAETFDSTAFATAIASALADVSEVGGNLALPEYENVYARLCFQAGTPIIEIQVSDVAHTTSIYTSSASGAVEVRAYRPYTEAERAAEAEYVFADDPDANINEIEFTISPLGDISDVATTKGSCRGETPARVAECAANVWGVDSESVKNTLIAHVNERDHWYRAYTACPILSKRKTSKRTCNRETCEREECRREAQRLMQNANVFKRCTEDEKSSELCHVIMQFCGNKKSRIAVKRNGDTITTQHIWGIAPYAIPELFGLIAHAAFGADWREQAARMNENRTLECAVMSNTGMSGCQYLSLIVRKDDAIRNFPTVAGFRVNSTGKVDELKPIWLGDLTKLAAAVDPDLTSGISLISAEIIFPRSWDDIKNQAVA